MPTMLLTGPFCAVISNILVEGIQLKNVLKLPSVLRFAPIIKFDTMPPPPEAPASSPVLIVVSVSKLWVGIHEIKKFKILGMAKVENAKFGNGVGVGAGIATLHTSGKAKDMDIICVLQNMFYCLCLLLCFCRVVRTIFKA